jgi:hypothetical protein
LRKPRNSRKGSSKAKQSAINAGKAIQRRIVNSALRGITDVQVLIHRSVFSGLYSLKTLQKKLGFGVRDYDSFEEYGRYSYKRDIQLGSNKIKLHFKPESSGYGPSCLIATNKSTYDHLLNIHNRLPQLKITRLEYAIDLYCRDHEAVADLFWLIRRYLYAPHVIRTSMAGSKFLGYQDYTRSHNSVYYAWKGKSSGRHIKVYERGPDRKRIPGTQKWHHKDVDRVRIEFKLKRTAITKKYGLSTLKELLIDPHFADITSEYVQFKNFKFSKRLPEDHKDYTSEDKQGNAECFLQEVLSAKDAVKVQHILHYVLIRK